MKTLNLDALAQTNRTLTLKGTTHAVEEMTVENFIESTKAAESLSDSSTLTEQMEVTIGMILRSVPTLERAVLVKMKMDQLTTIVQFVRGELDNEATPVAEGTEAGK